MRAEDPRRAADAYEKGGRPRCRRPTCAARSRSRKSRSRRRRASSCRAGLPARGRAVRVRSACWPRPRAPTRRARARRPRAPSTSAPGSRTAPRPATSAPASSRPRPSSTRRRADRAAPSRCSRRRASPSRAARRRRGRAIATGDRAPAARGARATRTTAPATELLARLFIEAGRPRLAVERLQQAIAGQPRLRREPRPLLLAGGGPGEGRARGRGAGALQEDPGREPAYSGTSTSAWRALEAGKRSGSPAAGAPPPRPRRCAPLRIGLRAAPARAPPAAAPPAAAPRAAPPAPAAGRAAAVSPPSPGREAASAFVPREEARARPAGRVYRAEDRSTGATSPCAVLPARRPDRRRRAQRRWPRTSRPRPRCRTRTWREGPRLRGARGPALRRHRVRARAGTSREALKAGHKMTVQQVHSLGRVLAQYLAFIHGKGLVHGSHPALEHHGRERRA